MKKLSTIVFLALYIGSLSLTSVQAADTTGDKTIVGQKITTLQATDSGLPGGVSEQKGSVGTILSKVFDATGQIGNVYLKAIGTITSGYVPRWNGTSLINGQIRDDGTQVGIGGAAVSGVKLNVTGPIRTTTDIRSNSYCDANGSTCFTPSEIDVSGGVIGGTGTANYITKFTGGTTIANSTIQDNGSLVTVSSPITANQTINAETGYTIGGKNLVSNNGNQVTANYPNDTRYGYFEVRNNSGQRGAYFGWGNGGNTVDLTLDNASNLDISGGQLNLDIGRGDVYFENNNNDNTDGAGLTLRTSNNPTNGSIFAVRSSGHAGRFWVGQNVTSSAQNPFYVGTGQDGFSSPSIQLNTNGTAIFNGTVTAATPTASTHLTTKSYVDNAIGATGAGLWTASGNDISNSNTGNVGIGTSATEKLTVGGQISGGFGAMTTAGTKDWNDSTNARSGNGRTLLLSTDSNGPGGSGYYHPFSFEYSSKDGNGNMAQFAIPYNGTSQNNGLYLRTRYGGTWQPWSRIISENTAGNVGIGTTSPDEKLQVVGNVMIGETDTTGGDLLLYGSTAGAYSRMRTTNGNLHIDAGLGGAPGNGVYLNFYTPGNVNMGSATNESDLTVNGEINQIGKTTNAYGITGRTASTSHGGVLGYSENATVYGILGHANAYGVYGYSPTNAGVYGVSAGGSYGVVGRTTNSSYGGVLGYNHDATAYGILGYGGNYALYGVGNGYFSGNVGIGATPTKPLDVAGQVRINQGANYDVWIEGEGTTGTVPRNLALLGHKASDTLYVNYYDEYSGGTRIGNMIHMRGSQIDNVTCIGNCF